MESLCKNSYLLAVDYLHKKVLSEMFYRVLNTEAVVSRCSSKYMFLKISKIDRKTPLLESLFEKLQACNFIKKRLQHWCLPANIAKFLRTAFFMEHLWWLVLKMHLWYKIYKKKI